MVKRLQENRRVAIFPEGGILPGEGVKRFHARLFAASIEAGVPVQPVMLRYLRDGARYDDITFLPGENFMVNFVRLLMQKRCVADVHVLPLIETAGQAAPANWRAKRKQRSGQAFESEIPGE